MQSNILSIIVETYFSVQLFKICPLSQNETFFFEKKRKLECFWGKAENEANSKKNCKPIRFWCSFCPNIVSDLIHSLQGQQVPILEEKATLLHSISDISRFFHHFCDKNKFSRKNSFGKSVQYIKVMKIHAGIAFLVRLLEAEISSQSLVKTNKEPRLEFWRFWYFYHRFLIVIWFQ